MPFRRSRGLPSVAPFSFALLGLNIVVYLVAAWQSAQSGTGSLFDIAPQVNFHFGAATREEFWNGEWFRIVAPIFLHWSMMHLLMNSWALWVLGPPCELYFGHANFLSIYLASGIGGSCSSILFTLGTTHALDGTPAGASAGASGAIFGILGAFLAAKIAGCWDFRRAWRNSEVRRLGIIILVLLFLSAVTAPNTDNWGHLGGLFFGAVFGYVFEKWRRNRRLNVLVAALPVVLLVCAVLVAQRPIFLTHWQINAALRAEAKGDEEQAAAHFRRAEEISRRLSRPRRSPAAANELFFALRRTFRLYAAAVKNNDRKAQYLYEKRLSRYAKLLRLISPWNSDAAS